MAGPRLLSVLSLFVALVPVLPSPALAATASAGQAAASRAPAKASAQVEKRDLGLLTAARIGK